MGDYVDLGPFDVLSVLSDKDALSVFVAKHLEMSVKSVSGRFGRSVLS